MGEWSLPLSASKHSQSRNVAKSTSRTGKSLRWPLWRSALRALRSSVITHSLCRFGRCLRDPVQSEITDLGAGAVFGELDDLCIQNHHIPQFAIAFQPHVHALIAHAAFRLRQEKCAPRLGKFNMNSHGGMMSGGSVTV